MTTAAEKKKLQDQAAALTSSIDALVVPPPVVIPPPVVEPPPIVGITATVVTRVANRPYAIIMGTMQKTAQGHVNFVGFSDRGRYDREQKLVELTGGALPNRPDTGPNTVVIRGYIEITATSSVPQLTWGTPWTAVLTLTPRVGAPIKLPPVQVAANTDYFEVVVDLSGIPEVDGGYLGGVSGAPAPWTVLEYPMYVRRTDTLTVPQTWMLAVVGSYTHHIKKMDGNEHFSYAWVPAKYEPVMIPLAKRTFPPVGKIPPVAPGTIFREMEKFVYTAVVPFREDDIYAACWDKVWTTANRQNYGFKGFYESAEPSWLVRQGQRGQATMVCPTFLLATARKDTPGKILFTQSHNKGTISEDGTVHIDFGLYHDSPPPYTNHDPTRTYRPKPVLKFAGKWADSVPIPRREAREFWGLAVWAKTTVINENLPPIGIPPQHPHLIDVIEFVTETAAARLVDSTKQPFGGRVLRLVYGKDDLLREATADEFINFPVGHKPWGCAMYGNTLLVTLVGPKLINAYDAETKALLWSFPMPKTPYGIAVLGNTAYIGTFEPRVGTVAAHGSMWKLDLPTRSLTKHYDCLVNDNSGMMNVAVDDGSFLEPGASAYASWSNNLYGWPGVHDAEGRRLPIGARNNNWGEPKGTLMPGGLSYIGSVYIGNGQMGWGTVQSGLHRISKALTTDLTVPADCFLGYQEYWDRNLHLLTDDYGWGTKGVKQQFGITPRIDAMLFNQGHRP